MQDLIKISVQTHSGSKPFPCPKCGKSFALRSYLVKHEESACGKNGDQSIQSRNQNLKDNKESKQTEGGCIIMDDINEENNTEEYKSSENSNTKDCNYNGKVTNSGGISELLNDNIETVGK